MLNFRRATLQPVVTNVELSLRTASNNAWLALQQMNYTGAMAQAEQALAFLPKDILFQQLIADAQAELSKRNLEPLQTLKGLLFVASPDFVEKRGAPDVRGVVVRGPDFLKEKNFENEIAFRLGKPITELELLRAQKTVVDWCRRTGHPLVDVIIPEQDIAGGVLQVAVIDGQVSWAHFSPDGKSVVTFSGYSNTQVWDVRTGQLSNSFKCTNSVHSPQLSPDGTRILPGSEIQYSIRPLMMTNHDQ